MTTYPSHWTKEDINKYNELKSELDRHQDKVANERMDRRNRENIEWREWHRKRGGGDKGETC